MLTDVAATRAIASALMVFDDRVRAFVPPQRGDAALAAVRTALIPVRRHAWRSRTTPAHFGILATRQRRRALIVFFTDVIDVRASRAFIAHVDSRSRAPSGRRGRFRNDALLAAATLRPLPSVRERELALYESAAAEELIWRGARRWSACGVRV